jgi:holo-[acyl-carrier protein] synthase
LLKRGKPPAELGLSRRFGAALKRQNPGNEFAQLTAVLRHSTAIGVDLVNVSHIAAAIDRFGERYIRRTFTAGEARYCRAGAAAAERFAGRFAAKEAVVKSLNPSAPWHDWRAIEIERESSGRCRVVLHGPAAALAARRRIGGFALSISHDGAHAIAMVVARRRPAAAARSIRHGHHR